MKRYDLVFSLGAACGCSQSLREARLQFASYPFDWVCCPGFREDVSALLSGFEGWFESSDLKLFDVRREPLSTKCYRNARTGCLFVHDFPISADFKEIYPSVAERFRLRADRLLRALEGSGTALGVYVEMPFRAAEPDEDYVRGRAQLSARFPNVGIDLVVFRNRKGLRTALPREIAPGVRLVELDFMSLDGGEISHQVNRRPLVSWLRKNVGVRDPQKFAEIKAYRAGVKAKCAAKWGNGSLLSRWSVRLTYKLYRRLERYLVGQALVPRERPFRF